MPKSDKPKQTFNLFIKTIYGNTITLRVRPDITLGEVKHIYMAYLVSIGELPSVNIDGKTYFYKRGFGEELIEVFECTSNTVEDVRSNLKLIFPGKYSPDSATLGEMNVQNETTLYHVFSSGSAEYTRRCYNLSFIYRKLDKEISLDGVIISKILAMPTQLTPKFFPTLESNTLQNLMSGADHNKPVILSLLEPGTLIKRLGNINGDFYSDLETTPSECGVSEWTVDKHGFFVNKQTTIFKVLKPLPVIISVAAMINDTWSIPDAHIERKGGGQQYLLLIKKDEKAEYIAESGASESLGLAPVAQ